MLSFFAARVGRRGLLMALLACLILSFDRKDFRQLFTYNSVRRSPLQLASHRTHQLGARARWLTRFHTIVSNDEDAPVDSYFFDRFRMEERSFQALLQVPLVFFSFSAF